MKLEPVQRIIAKTSHWPPEKHLQYLALAYQCEKNNRRRAKIYTAMRDYRTHITQKANDYERSRRS